MKATPKLQETLEVFLEEIESLKDSIAYTKPLSSILKNGIEEIKSVKIVPDLRLFNESKSDLLASLQKQNSKLQATFENNQKQLEELLKKNKANSSSLGFYLLVAFSIAVGASFFWINAQISNSKLKDEITSLKSYNTALGEYIKESKQIDKYNKWLEEKKSKE